MIRAKFVCQKVVKQVGQVVDPVTKKAAAKPVHEVTLTAVADGSEENKLFFASTPAGTIALTSILPGDFEPGQEYYVDFSAVPTAAAK